jgi:hypothetical protein
MPVKKPAIDNNTNGLQLAMERNAIKPVLLFSIRIYAIIEHIITTEPIIIFIIAFFGEKYLLIFIFF